MPSPLFYGLSSLCFCSELSGQLKLSSPFAKERRRETKWKKNWPPVRQRQKKQTKKENTNHPADSWCFPSQPTSIEPRTEWRGRMGRPAPTWHNHLQQHQERYLGRLMFRLTYVPRRGDEIETPTRTGTAEGMQLVEPFRASLRLLDRQGQALPNSFDRRAGCSGGEKRGRPLRMTPIALRREVKSRPPSLHLRCERSRRRLAGAFPVVPIGQIVVATFTRSIHHTPGWLSSGSA